MSPGSDTVGFPNMLDPKRESYMCCINSLTLNHNAKLMCTLSRGIEGDNLGMMHAVVVPAALLHWKESLVVVPSFLNRHESNT